MKKNFIIIIALIILGNTIIMILEKFLFLQNDMVALQNNLFSAIANSDVTSLYPPIILNKKITIWLSAFVCINIVLHYIKNNNKRLIKFILIGFYLVSCLANVIIVPHPLWFIIATIAIVIAPFYIVQEVFFYSTYFINHLKKDLKQQQSNYTTNLS